MKQKRVRRKFDAALKIEMVRRTQSRIARVRHRLRHHHTETVCRVAPVFSVRPAACANSAACFINAANAAGVSD